MPRAGLLFFPSDSAAPPRRDPVTQRLRVAIATPLSAELIDRIRELEPRLEIVADQSLLPPMRHPGDHEGDPAFTRTPEQQRAFETLLNSAEVLYGLPDEDPHALSRTAAANPQLRWVHTMAAGGGAQVKAAGLNSEQLARIAFTTSAGVHATPLTEFSLFGLLAGAKTLPRLHSLQRKHVWGERWMMSLISEQTILIVGLGSIGRATARALSQLGARVIGTSRHETTVPHVTEIIRPEALAEVAGRIDGIVVTLPGTTATEGLIGTDFFAALRSGATLVNVGRGTVVNEKALLEALDTGRVGFAALDVVVTEPLAPDNPLWSHPNVLISPHTAALNAAEDRLIAELFARNATRFLNKEPLINRVDTVEFY
ncbi:D-2-hydroxyacid dehydrogenase [Rathayibacter toxicus]|nr:D-2-hydroxyacid dehydrogenase [Rathayibacter toxicus]